MDPLVPAALAAALREAAFVVVQAPAGYGKTTSVRAALRDEPDVAWYDAQPWEAGAYAGALIGCVRTLRPDAGRLTLALAGEGAESARLAATFAEELSHVEAPLRIVVDDAHALGAGFGPFAATLARRMPRAVRLVLLARVPLDVDLPEAVADGRGALIDASVLRFDAARTREFAAGLGLAPDEARERALLQRTEGWPIAVALALRANSDVLLEELVARRIDALDPLDRDLLDATLAYETVEPELVAPGDGAFAARFAALAAEASLAAPAGNGFRVHPLVREALLRRIDEHGLAMRHGIAARTYAAANRLRAAMFHLERARDAALDETFLREHAAAAIASGLVDGVRAALVRLRAARSGAPQVLALVDGLLTKARGEDGRPSFIEAARAADAGEDQRLAFEARLQWVEADLGRGERVAPARIAELLARAGADGPAALVAASIRAGWADALSGRFTQALARLDGLADSTDRIVAVDVAPLVAYAHIALGDFEPAERVANALIDAWSGGDDLARYAGALVWSARFALLRGETTAAYELAREAERIARPFVLRAETAALHGTLAEAALHVGDYELARREARATLRGAESAWYARDAERMRTLCARILARADALEGDPARALAASTAVDPLAQTDAAAFAALCSAGDAAVRRVRARKALAAAEPYDGADAVALWSAAQTLDLLDALAGRDVETPLARSAFDGLVARRAEPVRLAELGVALRAHAVDAYESGLLVATARGPRFETALLARLAGPFLAGREAPAQWPQAPAEALTAREAEILELLAGGLTNREIAQRLILSARTVETHVARITGKLGVNSRARAVARAVALGLVAQAAVP